jgi:hypothetical protein
VTRYSIPPFKANPGVGSAVMGCGLMPEAIGWFEGATRALNRK